MFKNGNDYDGAMAGGVEDTVIGRSIKIEGDLVSNGSINVEGEVVGSLKTDKILRVGEQAKVVAAVKAEEAFISGCVEGNIVVRGKVELASSAVVSGDIQSSVLIIASGAVFNGRSVMNEKGLVNNSETVEVEDGA